VNAAKADEIQSDRRAATLGDLLFPDQAKCGLPESEWIRIVQSIGRGDQRALQTLYAHTHRLVFTLIMRITRDRLTAEELTLDVFHDVWRRAARYDATGGSVVGWIMNQARSRAIDRLRFERRKKRVNPHRADADVAPASEAPDDVWEPSERRQLLERALASLTDDERRAIETAYFSELTYRQAASDLNQPLGTLKTRIRSGLKKLRQALEQGTGTP
jgi:RNA polymerase sigma-70 factor, ECF subfamily